MSERSLTPAALTRQAIRIAEAGNLSDARQLLSEALRIDPKYEPAWLWYAHVAESDGERKFCLQRAADLKPDSAAKAALARFEQIEPEEPQPLADILDPEDPPTLTTGAEEQTRRRSTTWLILGLAAALALFAGLLAWQRNSLAPEESPLYIAFVGGLSTANAYSTLDMKRAVELELDKLNASGGIDGHPVLLLTFDDENDPEKAVEVAREIAADDRILAVVGHRTSAASLAAGVIYAESGIPAVTSKANADAVTETNPWYFRTIFDNSRQGTLISASIADLLGIDELILVTGTDVFGQSLGRSITDSFDGEIVAAIDLDGEEAIPGVIEAIRATGSDAPIVLAMVNALGTPFIVALRDAGITNPLVGGDAYSDDSFLRSFGDLPAEQQNPGFYTNGMVAIAPMFIDSLSADALRWYNQFEDAYGVPPVQSSGPAAEAALAIIHALRVAGIDPERSNEETRVAVRAALAGLNSPENSIPGVLGRIWFDGTRTTPRSAALGIATGDVYTSAPIQFAPYRPSGDSTLAEDLASGVAVDVGGTYLQRQRIVFTGVNLNEVSDLDLASQSFSVDFFIWFRYRGDESAVDVQFLNALDPGLGLGEPIREAKAPGGETYRLYRVNGRFRAQMQFQAFPFDTQNLVVQFQNRSLPASQLVYALDPELSLSPQDERLRSGVNANASINRIPNWQAVELDYYRQSIGSTAALGDPTVNVSNQGVEYSVLAADLMIRRDIRSFLIKNLLPLALLVTVTYVSLFFSHAQTGARVSFGVTGILTAAVLLSEVTGSLPDVGYNVAIEWAFYAFIGLCALCILVGLIGDYYYERRQLAHLRKLDVIARVIYPMVVIVVIALYWYRFRGA